MIDLKAVHRDLTGLFGGELAGRLIPLVVLPVLLRRLGPEAFGQVSFAAAAVAFFLLFASFGIVPFATRELAQCPREERAGVVQAIVRIRATGAALAFLALLFACRFVPFPEGTKALLVIQGGVLLVSAFDVGWIFLAIGGVRRMAYVNLAGQAVAAAVALLVVWRPADVSRYVATSVLASVVTTGLALRVVRRDEPWVFQGRGPKRMRYRAILKESGLLGIGSLGSQIYNKADVILLGYMVSATALGAYAVAYKLFEMGVAVMLLAGQAYFPYLASSAGDPRRLTAVAESYLRITATLAMAGMATTLVVAPDVMALFFGAGYLEGTSSLRILSLGFPAGALASLGAGAFLMLSRNTCSYVGVVLAAGILNLGLNLLLIPRMGIAAAALTTVLSQVFVGVVALWLRPVGVSMSFLKPFVPAAAGSAALLVVLFLLRTGLPPGRLSSIGLCTLAATGCGALAVMAALRGRNMGDQEVV